MRKFGTYRKNPNPPWPSQQSVVMVPPGSNAQAIGVSVPFLTENTDEKQGGSQTTNTFYADEKQPQTEIITEESERERRREPIMGQNNQAALQRITGEADGISVAAGQCGSLTSTAFLCGHIGRYVKMEFLFGENTHMEKIGVLHNVGKDFVSIRENGTNSIIVCSVNNIKFINIYDFEK